ncbi:MAG: restriction endonuclease, SacI family [Acetobacteraceae bacterium]
MARPIDHDAARALLSATLRQAEEDFAAGCWQPIPDALAAANEQLMRSATQAYREVLIGCCVARAMDPSIDVRLPYASQGYYAYSGRSLDEGVVNPFLQAAEIPASRGPFLSVFRRNVRFTPDIRTGLRDKAGFDALLAFIEALAEADRETAKRYLRHLLTGFVKLRDESNVALLHVQRLSIEQYETLIGQLLQTQSGGRWPVILSVAMFQTLKHAFNLDWQIEWQGINVADRASDVGGDITVRSSGQPILAVEVTERPIDHARVEATFRTKILPQRLTDYSFFHGDVPPTPHARALARRYFAQGHDISFLAVKDWLVNALATMGTHHRPDFTSQVIAMLRDRDVPGSLRLTWNAKVRMLLEL